MDKKFTRLGLSHSFWGLIYFLFIVGFPFVIWGDSSFSPVFFYYLAFPVSIVLTIATAIKYSKGDQKTENRWLLLLGGVYAMANLLTVFGLNSASLYLLFFILNIVFITSKPEINSSAVVNHPDKKFTWLGLAYSLFILGLPFATFTVTMLIAPWDNLTGLGLFLLYVVVLLVSVVLTIASVIKYYKGDQKTGNRWLLLLGGVYAMANLFSVFAALDIGSKVCVLLYLLFFILNIVFIVR